MRPGGEDSQSLEHNVDGLGRPPAFDAELYGLRNTVERGFNRLKQWRGVATRYDKYALTYLGGLLACAVIHARVGATKLGDTP